MKRVVNELKEQNLQIEGFLSEVFLKKQEIVGYDLFDLKKEKSIPFICKKGEQEWERVGSFFLIPHTLAKAKNIILQSKKADILIVDEIGPLELSGRGLWPALKDVIFLPPKLCLLVVRINVLNNFLGILKEKGVKVFDIRKKGVFSKIIEEIKRSFWTFF